jgi:hypothetical protein
VTFDLTKHLKLRERVHDPLLTEIRHRAELVADVERAVIMLKIWDSLTEAKLSTKGETK